MTSPNTVGIIVGRFQIPSLHSGHRQLFDTAIREFTEVGVVLGSTHDSTPDSRNPLPFKVRKQVVNTDYLNLKFIAEICDELGNDQIWSERLDAIISGKVSLKDTVYLVGSRDSFLKSYTGKYDTFMVPEIPNVSATSIRDTLARVRQFRNADWVAGLTVALHPSDDTIWSLYQHGCTDQSRYDWMSGQIWAAANLTDDQDTPEATATLEATETEAPEVPSEAPEATRAEHGVLAVEIVEEESNLEKGVEPKPGVYGAPESPIPTPTRQLIPIHENFILKTDSYKLTHWKMYDPTVEYVYSYFESRKGSKYDETVFVGLQYMLQTMVNCNITLVDIAKAERFCAEHFETSNEQLFDRNMWLHIVNDLGGRLPIRIKAVPEGSAVPVGNVLMTVENTDPRCAPLTNHLETLLTHIWYPSTVATVSRHIKKLIKRYMATSVPASEIDASLEFMLHDFGYRGVTCDQAAGIGGSAHLVNFRGTDTVEGIMHAKRVYGGSMAGFSVSASEHSVMTAKGRAGEYEVIETLIDRYPKGTLSLVLDSYNIYDAVTHLGEKLRDKVMARNGKLVVRPDSGHPPDVTLRIFEILDKYFESSVNSMGYKVLNPKVGVIYGDGLDTEMIETILKTMLANGWAASNIIFGMGGGLLQKVNRDTQRNAFKCSANKTADGEWHDVFKDPIDGSKKSKAGRLKLVVRDGEYQTVRIEEFRELDDQLVTVFENGEIVRKWSFPEIRARAAV